MSSFKGNLLRDHLVDSLGGALPTERMERPDETISAKSN